MSKEHREESRVRWIRKLVGSPPPRTLPLGIGDDAAVWKPPSSREVVLTVDTQAEGTHFKRNWFSARELGRRAVHASVSDLAAMAARPEALLVSLLLEEGTAEDYFRDLYRGIEEAARAVSAPIVGGNVSRGPLSVTVTALGSGRAGEFCRRDRLMPDQEVWVSGTPGLARLGLLALRGEISSRRRRTTLRRAIEAFLRPSARVQEALTIRSSWKAEAMIDLSDGLGADLHHLIQASSKQRTVGIELKASVFERMEPLATLASACGLDPLQVALRGGEDYELCFASPPRTDTRRSLGAFRRRFGVDLTHVGRVVNRSGLWIVDPDGKRHSVAELGFEHFG